MSQQNLIEEAVIDHFGNIFNGTVNPDSNPTQGPDDDEIPAGTTQAADIETKYESRVCAPMTMTELQCILEKLPNEKSSGYDQIPGEFLKNAGLQFKRYLLLFYNKIIDDGEVPS